MAFSVEYAILFGLAGFAAGAVVQRARPGSVGKEMPWFYMGLCALFTLGMYGIGYAVLTIIEYGIGYGIAHALFRPREPEDRDKG